MIKDKTPEWKILSFDWLPVEKWTIDTVMNSKAIDGNRYCKICDDWVKIKECDKHIKHHVKEQQVVAARLLAEHKAKVAEERRIRVEEARLLRAQGLK